MGVLAMAAFVCVSAGQAVAGPVFWDTGEDGVGGVLANGQTELHYKLFDASNNPMPDPIVTTYNEAWKPAPAGSMWISLTNPPQTAPYVRYSYRLDFWLDAIPTEDLSGAWMTDDAGTSKILLNGVDTGLPSANFFVGPQAFSISSGFQLGLNTIEFNVGNEIGHAVTGLCVSGLGFPPEYVVPAPAASLLVALGSCAVGFLRRRSWF